MAGLALNVGLFGNGWLMPSTSPQGLRFSVMVSDSAFKELVLISRINNNYNFNIKN
ncbi:hypothetical protein ALQ60_02436 [Pseudomonas syringae pv. papulans]|nr:Unknown protein sequence [Pseudomonas syringae pv. syringae]KPY33921.1 Unknown protein sequence [Pseudomonas syringae pv. papulans]RMN37916.1 hypothetical protein ALQ60_02436 [Pseudomonas syringae pv. papulans]RMN57263.1 hypothetical protein ALQ56_03962 [Pseudomonas syringae pv. papulans]RMV42455.1 hypothetical protein ALP11_02710 [Pseudomonas syringae pv. papulans]